MSLLQVFLASLGSFALSQFALIPWSKHRLQIDRSMTSIGRAAMLATFGHARSVLLIVTATTAVLLSILKVLVLQGGTTIEQLESAVLTLQAWRARLAGFGPVWGGTAVVLLVIALGVHAHRSGKRRMERLFQGIRQREWERLRTERQEGRLEELPPTREMTWAQQDIDNLTVRRDRLLELAGTSEGRADLIESLTQRIAVLQGYLAALDIGRRIRLELGPDQAVPPAPRSRWEKLQSVLYSDGLLLGLGAGSRLLHAAGLVLLIPSLLGVCSPAVDRVLDNQATQLSAQLDELSKIQVFKNVQQAKQSFDRALKQPAEGAKTLDALDDEVLRRVSVQFEKAIASSRVWGNITPQFARPFEFRSMAVRDQILTRYSDKAGLPIKKHPAMADLVELTPIERETSRIFSLAHNRGPTSSVGRKLYSDLRAAASRSPSLVDTLRAGLGRLKSPATSEELSFALFRRIAELVVDPEAGPLGEAVRRNLDVASLRKAIAQYQDATRQQFVADIIGGKQDVAGALDGVMTADGSRSLIARADLSRFKDNMRAVYNNDLRSVFAEKRPAGATAVRAGSPGPAEPEANSLMGKLRSYPPSVDEVRPPHVDLKKAGAIVERMETDGKLFGAARSNVRYSSPLAAYTESFPAQLGAERAFKGAPRSMSVRGTSESSALKFRLSRDFFKLQGFSETGGVLIGRPPTLAPGETNRFVDFRWEADGPRLRLILVDGAGRILRSRPHQISLIRQALAYAADGRPVAVSIIPSPPLFDLKVLLHPVFLDTLLGSRLISLDNFVLDYTGSEAFHIEARNNLDAQMALYTRAWALRVRAVAAQLSALPDLKKEWRELLKNFDRLAQDCLGDRELAAEASYALKDPTKLANREHSPLTAKEKFFDRALVAAMIECAGPAPNMELDRFDERLRLKVDDSAKSLARSLEDARTEAELDLQSAEVRRWLYQFPSFEVTGGVRERAFGSNPAELLMPDGEQPALPFDFSLQIAFTSNALRDAILGGDTKYSAADEDPWDFPSIKKKIHEKVMERIRADTTASDEKVIADVSELVFLQRLFRMALSGDLGSDFPVEKLAELTAVATKTKSPLAVHTLRWDSYPGQLEQLLSAQIMFGLKLLGERERVPAKESIPHREMKRILESRATVLGERLQKWNEFREELARCASEGLDLHGPWDRWEAWDKVWQGRWATLEGLDSVLAAFSGHDAARGGQMNEVQPHGQPVARSRDTASLKPDDTERKLSALKSIVFDINASMCALEMRQVLGVARDDRKADLQRVRRIASWRRLMGAVARSYPPQA
jgi:hypothetical protein